ncbi:MAG: HU family DNA-binding protein [Deltaproteobacteria bacterium]|jgi:DNA-binding protein HU-beta|nr:HU family DNA-binding protein [Deltaproteobacteria bacterium]
MNKTELIAAIAAKTEQPKTQVAAALEAFAETLGEVLKKDEKVTWTGFGTFSVTKRAARKGRNPKTGKAMKIKASKSPKFKAGKTFKESI